MALEQTTRDMRYTPPVTHFTPAILSRNRTESLYDAPSPAPRHIASHELHINRRYFPLTNRALKPTTNTERTKIFFVFLSCWLPIILRTANPNVIFFNLSASHQFYRLSPVCKRPSVIMSRVAGSDSFHHHHHLPGARFYCQTIIYLSIHANRKRLPFINKEPKFIEIKTKPNLLCRRHRRKFHSMQFCNPQLASMSENYVPFMLFRDCLQYPYKTEPSSSSSSRN